MMKLPSVLLLLLLVPLLSSSAPLVLPLDCSDVYTQDTSRPSGVYTIYPIGVTSAVLVYCDMDSQGQWTVFQRRMDGSLNFYRPWEQYKMGFGNAVGEYWLGLENLFYLTQRKRYELLVDMEDFNGNKVFSRYSSFSIDTESDGYKLNVSGFTNGGADLTDTCSRYESGLKVSSRAPVDISAAQEPLVLVGHYWSCVTNQMVLWVGYF